MAALPTAALVRRDLLDPLLDAQALNDHQARELANVTPEPDCIADHLNAIIARTTDPVVLEHATEALSRATRVFDLNGIERGREQHATGTADSMVRDLRDGELNGDSPAVTAKDVARVARRTPDLIGLLGAAEAAAAARVVRYAPVGSSSRRR
jgi:hypothetical protein